MDMDGDDMHSLEENDRPEPNGGGGVSEDIQIIEASGEKDGNDQGMAIGPKSVTVRVRNKLGGNNPQLGPRVRDAKKATCGGGQLKVAINSNNGASVGHKKENLHPNIKVPVGKDPIFKDVTELARELME